MKLKLSKATTEAMYPTGRTKPVKKTFLDGINREVVENEVVEMADKELGASYVASGLMEPADAESGRAVASVLEGRRAGHQKKADELEAKAKDHNPAVPPLDTAEEHQLESEKGYVASINSVLARLALGENPPPAEAATAVEEPVEEEES